MYPLLKQAKLRNTINRFIRHHWILIVILLSSEFFLVGTQKVLYPGENKILGNTKQKEVFNKGIYILNNRKITMIYIYLVVGIRPVLVIYLIHLFLVVTLKRSSELNKNGNVNLVIKHSETKNNQKTNTRRNILTNHPKRIWNTPTLRRNSFSLNNIDKENENTIYERNANQYDLKWHIPSVWFAQKKHKRSRHSNV